MMQFPSVSEIFFGLAGEFPQFDLFPENFQKIFRFSILNFPPPPIPSYFGKLFFSPTFAKSPPDFVKFTCFYILYVYFPPTLTMMHLCITQCTYMDAPAPVFKSRLKTAIFKPDRRFCTPQLVATD